MNRGEVWWAHVGRKRRPVLVLTRPEVIAVREMVTVAEITTSIRGLAVEVPVGETEAEVPADSAINCDGLHTIRRSSLTAHAGAVSDVTMQRVCRAVSYAIGC